MTRLSKTLWTDLDVIKIQDGFLFGLASEGLMIFDLSNPRNPELVSSLPISELIGISYSSICPSLRLSINGDRAYVACRERGWIIIDISNVLEPKIALRQPAYSNCYGILANEKNVFTFDQSDSLFIFEVSDTNSVELITKVALVREVHDAEATSSYLFLTYTYGGLQIVDVSYPLFSVLTGTYDINESTEIAVNGSYAYLYGMNYGLHVVNVSNQNSPELTGSIPSLLSQDYSKDMFYLENKLYLISDRNSYVITDVSDPGNPVKSSGTSIAYSLSSCVVEGRFAYIANNLEGISVIDNLNPQSPKQVGTYLIPQSISQVKTRDSLTYALGGNGFYILNTTNRENPQRIGCSQLGSSILGICGYNNYILGHRVFTSGMSSWATIIYAIDVSDPTLPVIVDSFNISGYVTDVDVVGDYLYSCFRDSTLKIISLLDCENLYVENSIPFPYSLSSFTNGPSHGVISHGTDGISLIDVSDPISPIMFRHYSLGTVSGFEFFNNYGITSNYDFKVFDMSDLDSVYEVYEGSTPGMIKQFGFYEQYALLANYQNEIRVYDFSSFDQSPSVDVIDLNGRSNTIEVVDDYILIGDVTGLSIYQVQLPTGADDNSELTLPNELALKQNRPNPFNAGTVIEFTLPRAGATELKILNILGEVIATPMSRTLAAGEYQVSWNGIDCEGHSVPTGVYFYLVTSGDYSQTKKMILLK